MKYVAPAPRREQNSVVSSLAVNYPIMIEHHAAMRRYMIYMYIIPGKSACLSTLTNTPYQSYGSGNGEEAKYPKNNLP